MLQANFGANVDELTAEEQTPEASVLDLDVQYAILNLAVKNSMELEGMTEDQYTVLVVNGVNVIGLKDNVATFTDGDMIELSKRVDELATNIMYVIKDQRGINTVSVGEVNHVTFKVFQKNTQQRGKKLL